jgi:hypothetical protein
MEKILWQRNAKKALTLAGELAIACAAIAHANIFQLSGAIENMKKKLDAYDKYICDWTKAKGIKGRHGDE